MDERESRGRTSQSLDYVVTYVEGGDGRRTSSNAKQLFPPAPYIPMPSHVSIILSIVLPGQGWPRARPPTRPPPLLPFPPHPSLATMGVKVVPLIRSPRPLSRSRRSFPTPTPTAEQGAAAMATHAASCDAGHINEDSFTWVLDKRYPRNNPLE